MGSDVDDACRWCRAVTAISEIGNDDDDEKSSGVSVLHNFMDAALNHKMSILVGLLPPSQANWALIVKAFALYPTVCKRQDVPCSTL